MKTSVKQEILRSARILWDYLRLDQPLRSAEGLLIFCSNDLRVAEYASELFHQGFAPWVCPSGGVGRLTYDLYRKPEAEAFAEVLRNNGVPDPAIYIENQATNTAENIFFTKRILEFNNLKPASLLVLQKPYMERRTLAALTQYWPEMNFVISSPPISFDNYPFDGFSMDDLIHVLVGDFQRIHLYALRGWQTPQPIPQESWAAYDYLVNQKYIKQLADSRSLPSKP
jgi:uncharacterized SAM-binding protein YcdF (DUF218 family)